MNSIFCYSFAEISAEQPESYQQSLNLAGFSEGVSTLECFDPWEDSACHNCLAHLGVELGFDGCVFFNHSPTMCTHQYVGIPIGTCDINTLKEVF